MIPISKPSFSSEEVAAVSKTIESGWVGQGPKVEQFENAFAAYVGSGHACAVSSGTAALHLALVAVGVRPGDVVLTVSHSFIATANAIRMCGAEPVFIDINFETYNLCPDELKKVLQVECVAGSQGLIYKDISKLATGESPLTDLPHHRCGRVAAILAAHQIGMPCDIAALGQLAKKYQLPLVEDAACAIGSAYSTDGGKAWDKIGMPHGDIACFSFHPRKVLTTGEGGMITTNDRAMYEEIRLLRQHGMTLPATARHGAKSLAVEEYVRTAYNYRLTDLQAAMGIVQLRKLDSFVIERQRVHSEYKKHLESSLLISLPADMAYTRSNWQSYAVKLSNCCKTRQHDVIQQLLHSGISSKPGIMNAHTEKPYKPQRWTLENSEQARQSTVLLPCYDTLSNEDIRKIAETLKSILSDEIAL